jgi:hypothetical protein
LSFVLEIYAALSFVLRAAENGALRRIFGSKREKLSGGQIKAGEAS